MVSCTVVIPTHNREVLLERAVRSALAACPADGEVLVVDDKSIVPATHVLAPLRDDRLRVVLNPGESGAAHSRNLGVHQAAGAVIFFLDDDDEMLTGYCARVLSVGGPSSCADWGFSSTVERREGAQAQDLLRVRRRLRRGLASMRSRPRDLVAAMSDGLWIRRDVMLQLGGLDVEQLIDEDTDLCVRLLATSRTPWYEVEPGTIVYRGYVPARAEGAQLTVATPIQEGVQCYRRSHDKNFADFGSYSAMRWFLATRYVRRAVKAGYFDEVKTFVCMQKNWLLSSALAAYAFVKQLTHR